MDEKTGKLRSSSALLQESAQGVAGGRDGAVSLPITLWPLLPRGCPERMSACGTNKETRLSDEVGGTISFRTKEAQVLGCFPFREHFLNQPRHGPEAMGTKMGTCKPTSPGTFATVGSLMLSSAQGTLAHSRGL